MPDTSPLVSILINAFNSEAYIKEALDSALAQTYSNIEIVVVDDASTDRTAEIIKSYADSRIRYFYCDHNQGIVGSRNYLLREARGDFLTWLDADDVYLPDKVKGEVNFLMAHPEFAGVYCNILYFFDDAPEKLYRHVYAISGNPSGDIFASLLEKMFITNTAFMFRRSVYEKLGGFNPETGIVEDWEYFLRMARRGMQFGFLDKDLVRYRLRWNSNTNFARQVEIKESQVKIFENLGREMSAEDRVRWDMDRWIAARKENLIVTLLSAGKRDEALRVYAEIKNRLSLKKRLFISCMLFFPASILRLVIEYAWNYRKRRLFVPV